MRLWWVVSLIVVVTVMTILKKCCKLLSALMCHWLSDLSFCVTGILSCFAKGITTTTPLSIVILGTPSKIPIWKDGDEKKAGDDEAVKISRDQLFHSF